MKALPKRAETLWRPVQVLKKRESTFETTPKLTGIPGFTNYDGSIRILVELQYE